MFSSEILQILKTIYNSTMYLADNYVLNTMKI